MGSKGGGGYDAGPSIEYGNKALALQEKMYNESVERTGPYYDTGTAGLSMLADLLGIQGGSVKTRDQWREELAPSYTYEEEVAGDPISVLTGMSQHTGPLNTIDGFRPQGEKVSIKLDQPINAGRSVTRTDTEGLNAALEERMANQERPDNFGSLLQSFDLDKFHADPGYQFRLDEGQKAIERAASARGQYYDPSTVKALNDYNSNMADQTYNDSYNRYNMDQSNIFNRLAAISGIGQTANSQMNAAGANNAAAAGQVYGQMGSAMQAAQNANASQPSMFDTLLGVGAQLGSAYLTGGMASDIRVKENIERIGLENGFPTYKFNYKGGDKQYIGVMAQDVQQSRPDAVIDIDGVLHVDYGKIGVEMRSA